MAISSTQKNFELITNNLINKIKNESKQIHRILNANINNKKMFSKINFEHNTVVIEDLTEIMSINPIFYAIYFAHKDGSFFEIINMKEDSSLYNFYKADKLTRWTVIVNKDNKMQYTFLDEDKNILSKTIIDKKYNPLQRPWYKYAISTDKPITTQPYNFSNIKTNGITFARKMNLDGGVFAIDFTLRQLNNILALQTVEENSEVFIFNSKGVKIASSNNFTDIFCCSVSSKF